jgi:hypothetical protein
MNTQMNTMNSTATQSVEVSGWDAEGQFFVEIAELILNDSGDRSVSLCHHVYSGSLVFLRLLHGDGDEAHEKGHPTAHEAQAAEPPDFTGRSRVRLISCQPRAPRRGGDRSGATRI